MNAKYDLLYSEQRVGQRVPICTYQKVPAENYQRTGRKCAFIQSARAAQVANERVFVARDSEYQGDC